jgi:hypothetical protein
VGDFEFEVGVLGGVDNASGAVSPAVVRASETNVAPQDEQKRPDSNTSAPHEGHLVVFKFHLVGFRFKLKLILPKADKSYIYESSDDNQR